MKKRLLFLAALVWISSSIFAQTSVIIAQWTFPTGIDTLDVYPDSSTVSYNLNKYLSAEDTVEWPNTNLRDVSLVSGASTYAAAASGWDSCANAKLWSVKFKTDGANNITVSSIQSSDAINPGPKYWKIQARLSADTVWTDIPGGDVTCADDWTTGSVTDLALPATFDGQTGSMFIRWIAVSDSSTADTLVGSLGVSKIDNVIIKGEAADGTVDILYNSTFNYFPNPNIEKSLNIVSTKTIKELIIYSVEGKLMKSLKNNEIGKSINLSSFNAGVYFIQAYFDDNSSINPQKLIIQ
ncbi:MAG: T9SS type A sorting domain-containing protein [Bacteroidetes bacterium]|nr:T9SS type A sorting domain-containing protein [Bacteroidota bacterium]